MQKARGFATRKLRLLAVVLEIERAGARKSICSSPPLAVCGAVGLAERASHWQTGAHDRAA